MKHAVKHDLEPAVARRVADRAWESYAERFAKYEPTIDWVSETRARIGFRAKGLRLGGELEILPREIGMDLEVPFLLRPFRQKAISVIESEIEKWIGKAKRGEL